MIKVDELAEGVFRLGFTNEDLETLNHIYKTTGTFPDDYVEAVLRVAFESFNEG